MHGPTDRVDSATDSATPPSRSFQDAECVHWHVYERTFADYDRRSGTSLVFFSDGAVRRVRDYPAHWLELSDEDLIALSWKA